MVRRVMDLGALGWVVALVGSCAFGPARALPKDPFETGSCNAFRPPTEPDLMAWDPGSRVNLNRLRQQGVVAVHYEGKGCNVELELLSNCIGTVGEYKPYPYTANERKEDHTVRDLYADLPVGAASLSGYVKDQLSLVTDYMIAGQLALPAGTTYRRADLRGPDCARATHVVTAIHVGAFAMASGESQKIHAKASVFGLGGGAGGESEVRRVKEEGNADACKESQRDQKMGDARCSVPLRIGLLELDAPSAPVCPEGSVLRGDQCERPATCAPGTQWNGTECVGHLAPARSGGSCPAGMAALPGGTFQMGDRGDIVSVQPFCMDVTEVTVSAFEMCISMGGCTAPYSYLANDSSLTNRSCNYKRPGSGNHPINCVTWDQAAAYCGWASKRLPSEEEWEWASRGASDGRTYPWGEAAPSPDRVNACGPECVSWVKENLKLVETAMYASSDGWPTTAPVGSFPRGATPQGLQDMAGNVWEWTASNYRDSFGRVLRGGSWMHGDASNLRAGDRNPIGPRLFEDGALGFRCAR